MIVKETDGVDIIVTDDDDEGKTIKGETYTTQVMLKMATKTE